MEGPISSTKGQRLVGEEAHYRGSTEEPPLERIKKTWREAYQERYVPSHKPRVMLDTSVLTAGIVWPRWPYEILRLAREGKLELVVCQFSIDKLYRHIKSDFPDTFPNLAETIALYPYTQVDDPTTEVLAKNVGFMREPADIPLALAAIAAQVDFFITEDQDFTDRTPDNRELHRRLTIILPSAFLRLHAGWTSEQLEAIRYREWKDVL